MSIEIWPFEAKLRLQSSGHAPWQVNFVQTNSYVPANQSKLISNLQFFYGQASCFCPYRIEIGKKTEIRGLDLTLSCARLGLPAEANFKHHRFFGKKLK